ncbi:hypothetical protein HDN1F_04350 [gamma proteobacterium HdN1]|nr:hypothetical protein HDN1F_04350 [gamma proteobacterium HdN1]
MKQMVWVAGAAVLLTGCGLGMNNGRQIPKEGVAAAIQVNLPKASQEAQVVATVYKDGVAQPLVGGDVIQARTAQSLSTLRAEKNLDGHYQGVLAVDHADTPIDVAVNYDDKASSEQRWFASDTLTVSPGPGSLVGYEVTGMRLPPEIYLSAPMANTVYRDMSDTVELHWDPLALGHQVRLTAAVSCVAAGLPFSYGLSFDLGKETDTTTGSYSLRMNKLVTAVPVVVALRKVLDYLSLYASQQMLGQGNFLAILGSLPKSDNEINKCDVDLTLIREQENTLPPAFSGGYAITSRSDTVRVQYVQQ